LTEYTFGNKKAVHKFCKTCGSSVFVVAPAAIFGGDGEDIFGVNVSTPHSQIPIPRGGMVGGMRERGRRNDSGNKNEMRRMLTGETDSNVERCQFRSIGDEEIRWLEQRIQSCL
jgi:hypothetical protein